MEKKKVIIDYKQLAGEINKQPDFFYLFGNHSDRDVTERAVRNTEAILRSLLSVHKMNSNCCPDITRRLELAIAYVRDIEII